jgi:hypothetical protein
VRKSLRKIDSEIEGVNSRARAQFEEAVVQRVELAGDCLFPMEQGATGINSSTPTASLTGRIWFFCCCFDEPLLTNYS